MKLKLNSKGFTLIELLIVIGIIGILAAVIMISLNRSRSNSRDAKRVADVREVLSAIQLYYTNNEDFPPDCAEPGYAGGCDMADFMGTGFGADTSTDGQFLGFLSPDFMQVPPSDPLNGPDNYYMYATDMEYPPGSGVFYHYLIGTILENEGNNRDGITPPTGYETYYFVGERE